MTTGADMNGDQAFFRGIEKFCSANGTPEFSAPLAAFAKVAESCRANPEAFAKGFDSIVKEAFDRDGIKSWLGGILPWIVIPAAIYGGTKWGEIWGRHAQAVGNDRGPVSGPLMSAFESLAGTPLTYVGRDNAKALYEKEHGSSGYGARLP